MDKWIALILIAIGGSIVIRAKPMGEFGFPLYVLVGVLSLVGGIIWLGILVFIAL